MMYQKKVNHSVTVGRYMEKKALMLGWGEEKAREMFVLGYLHDIGYEHCTNTKDHPTVGGLMLKSSGYKYWQEVFWHGQVQGVYSTPELLLLNEADLSVDANGNLVGVAMRIADIGMRYGFGSDEYNGAKELAKKLGLGKMIGDTFVPDGAVPDELDVSADDHEQF